MLVDHPEVSRRVFYPRRTALKPTLTVDVGGATLGCYLHQRHPGAGTLLHFHGNGELAADYSAGGADRFLQMGVNVCFVEYRGYGASTGRPSLGAMLPDGEQVVKALGLAPEKVVAFGRSLGSLYAVELTRRLPQLAGLVLESGIADVVEVLRLFVADPADLGSSWEEVRREAAAHFDQKAKLEGYRGRLLVLHAAHDTLLLPVHARRLYAWGGGPEKKLVVFPAGDHNTIFVANAREYLGEVAAFLRETGISQEEAAGGR
jgi:pimeloyl-ACP methyl ester carboxylesterase